jgi:hypothetical protein
MSKKPKPTTGKSKDTETPSTPPFIMHEVKLLFGDLTPPEAAVKFDPPSRANPATIQDNIKPPTPTWTWNSQSLQQGQTVTPDDVGKYGLRTDINTLFRLNSVAPAAWEAIRDFSQATWRWLNETARLNERVTKDDVGKIGIQTDIDTYYKLTLATPPVWQTVANPTDTSSPLELSTGAADADSYHDFFRLRIAFEDVWTELLDSNISQVAQQLYGYWDALMDPTTDHFNVSAGYTGREEIFSAVPTDSTTNKAIDISGVDQLNNFIADLKALLGVVTNSPSYSDPTVVSQIGNALQQAIYQEPFLDANVAAMIYAGLLGPLITNLQSQSSPPSQINFPDLTKLMTQLDVMLKEKYQFDVFAPDSVNFGLLLNYRQRWQPQSYQVGNLVSTIPLAPQETRRYTTKTVVKKTRNVKEIDDSLRSGKDESSNTWRLDAEVVDRAKNQTNFQTNASGSYGKDGIYKVEAGMQAKNDQAIESAQTKRDFHESVVKSAQEYRSEHRLEITTEESREEEATSYREIRNPNDELTVTYLFYELQRRYLVSESLYKATPVILVANEVPAPHEVEQSWLLRHDWILKRAILDDSYLPALEYLSTNYEGEELTLQELRLAVEHQRLLVDRISQQVQIANQSLDAATSGLETAQNQQISDLKTKETIALVKSFFDPLKIAQTGTGGDGNSDRAAIDFAKDALNRAQAKASLLTGDLRTETTALQLAIDKYTTAATKHFSMLAEIDRLRLHVKDNIIHYMQAIWTYEPTDQRYFRLYNVVVPVFGHHTKVSMVSKDGLALADPSQSTYEIRLPPGTLLSGTRKLHQVADIDNLLGFKGNYMIFPMTNFDYMTWYLMHEYIDIDATNGVTAQDPDPGADLTIPALTAAMASIYARDSTSFAKNEATFEEIMLRLLSTQNQQMVILPSNSLYIEALPGTHPLLEDFKLIHRAIDIKKAQAETRHAELENLRLGARLANGEYGDPDIDKVVVVGNGKNVTVDAGQ